MWCHPPTLYIGRKPGTLYASVGECRTPELWHGGCRRGVVFAGSEHGYMRIYPPMDGRYSSVKDHARTLVKRPGLSVRNRWGIEDWTTVQVWTRIQTCHMWSLRRIMRRKCSESLGKAPAERRTGKHETGNVCWLRAFLRFFHDSGKVESSQFRGFRVWHRLRTMPIRLASRLASVPYATHCGATPPQGCHIAASAALARLTNVD